MRKQLKIGTRGSHLALWQAEAVRDELLERHPELDIALVEIMTSGDWKPADGEVRLKTDAGGKALFAKEIQNALLAGEIDVAVHSMKDLETTLPGGTMLGCMLEREDERDSFIINNLSNNIHSVSEIPEGAKVGTASVRRQGFLLSVRPDLEVVPLRGNVHTRIEKLRAGQVDVTLLALAGLRRLGLEDEIAFIADIEEIIPAAGQGAIGVEMREGDEDVLALFKEIGCPETYLRVMAERAVLEVLEASCHTPIGVYAVMDGHHMRIRAAVVALDGSQRFDQDMHGAARDLAEAQMLGRSVGEFLKAKMPEGFLAQQVVD